MKIKTQSIALVIAVSLGAVLLETTAYSQATEVLAMGNMADSELFGGPATITVRRLTIAPGGVLGWHYHPGVGAYTVVKRGTLTLENGCGGEEVYTAGQAFLETAGHIHRGKNLGTEEVETIQTFVVPTGTPISVSSPQSCSPPEIRITSAVGPTTVAPGQPIMVAWSSQTPRPANDWFGIYALRATDTDANIMGWLYTGGGTSGSLL
jgi:quercetin dioxygenase-like cupin family protein